MSLNISIGCGDRDLNRSLITGDVSFNDISASVTTIHPSNRHRKFFRERMFDVCEVSLASYLSSRIDTSKYSFTAIPVFPAKRFRHSFFYVHKDAELETPADLEGAKVGISSWQTTANVWMRGIAKEHYGLDLREVQWYQRKCNDVGIEVPERYNIQKLPGASETDEVPDRTELMEMFFNGELDAVMDPSGTILYAVAESNEADFMFDDPMQEEKQYYEQTGIHPPMHTVVIRDEIVDDQPWVARRVYEAFCESRDRCLERSRQPFTNTSITWSHLHVLEQMKVLGSNLWEFGLTDGNRTELNKFIEYSHDQGLIPEEYNIDDIFIDV